MADSKQFAIDFLTAAMEGDVPTAKRLADERGSGKGELASWIANDERHNALHLAVQNGKTEMCELLIDYLGFDINVQDCKGNTPLIIAIQCRQHATALFLIEKGADIGLPNIGGLAALHAASGTGQIEMMRLLLSRGVHDLNTAKVYTPLQRACDKGEKEAVKLLLDHGADPNATVEPYESPLMISVWIESPECIELLLEAGADPNLISFGSTALVYAACKGNTEIIKRLLKAGANPDVVELSKLMTPLEFAAIHSHVDAVKTLFPVTSRISSISDWSVDGLLNTERTFHLEARIQMLDRNTDYIEKLKAKGRAAFVRRDYITAVGWYNQAAKLNPKRADVRSNKSLCWAMLNQHKQALKDAEACVRIDPKWPKGYYRLGEARMLLHQYSKAREAFSKALRLDPKNKAIEMAHREAIEAELAATLPFECCCNCKGPL